MKPGGFFFSYDPNFYNPAFWIYRSKSSPFYSSIGITSNERLLKAKEVTQVFSKEGFETHVKIKTGISFCYVESEKTRPLLKVYNILDGILAITPFSMIIGAWIIGFGTKK